MSTVTPAILVLTFLLVAGGGWHWAYERHVVTYRKGDKDRLARLAAASVAYLAIAAWPLYEIYDQIWPVDAEQRSHPSWWVWPLVPAGLAAPIVIGALLLGAVLRDRLHRGTPVPVERREANAWRHTHPARRHPSRTRLVS